MKITKALDYSGTYYVYPDSIMNIFRDESTGETDAQLAVEAESMDDAKTKVCSLFLTGRYIEVEDVNMVGK